MKRRRCTIRKLKLFLPWRGREGQRLSVWKPLVRSHWSDERKRRKSTTHWNKVGVTLAHRLRHWPNATPTVFQCVEFAGKTTVHRNISGQLCSFFSTEEGSIKTWHRKDSEVDGKEDVEKVESSSSVGTVWGTLPPWRKKTLNKWKKYKWPSRFMFTPTLLQCWSSVSDAAPKL